ncbi:zinc-type alcohol dehydrogenase-like protein C2E1P3.01 [Aspergillus udagawae]|uniref:Zinc-type alcohol dehydrogenase-like protein C2E1P3.01 n=1 Tax=Aspergillus udagawae TaxID=91492 RepID=A0A8H3NHX1_9EURO|nr:zinc-type alcohol dehydrogenase-like protein C2E1P3.01 [Aspergillus udagawae]
MQKAIAVTRLNSPAVLVERPIPNPEENQLLVQVTAAGLNPLDQKTRDVGLFFKGPAQVLGHELAGVVVRRGAGTKASQFAVGEHIFAHVNFVPGQELKDCGGLQQFALVDARFAARVAGTGLSDEEAAGIPVCAMASFIALFHSTGLGLPLPPAVDDVSADFKNHAILIVGGGSNCGRFAVQFARMLGFGIIVTVASSRNTLELKGMGATHVIDRYASHDEILRQIRDVTGDELIYALDTVNVGPAQNLGLAALSNTRKGCLITLNPVDETETDKALIEKKAAGYDRRLTFGFSALYPEVSMVFWENVVGWLQTGHLRSLRCEFIEGAGPDRINAALDGYRDGHEQKIVVSL